MHKIHQLLQQHEKLRPLLSEANLRQQWQMLWEQTAPEFRNLSEALALSEGILTVTAYSGIIANRIKLQESELLQRLHAFTQKSNKIKGLNISAIKVKVQVKNISLKSKKRIRPLSNRALQALSECAEHTANMKLKHALRTLIKHQEQS